MARQDNLNQVFTDEITRVKEQLELTLEAVGVMDRALGQVLERVAAAEPGAAAALRDYKKAMAELRRQGLRDRHEAPVRTTCPQCQAVLRVAGDRGDRCDWCGYLFPLKCPSCGRTLPNLKGEPGERCLGCQHVF